MIRKIIHQVWVGDKKRPEKWMQTWIDKHPDWTYMLWDNNRVWDYPFKNKEHITRLIQERKFHGAADIIRYEAIYDFGGTAMPADSECVNPIDELLEIGDNDCFSCFENEVMLENLMTPVLGGTQHNPLMKLLIDGLYEKKPEEIKEPWIDTGNKFLTDTVEKNQYDKIRIYPSSYFMPNHRLGGNWDGESKIYSLQFSGTTFDLYE